MYLLGENGYVKAVPQGGQDDQLTVANTGFHVRAYPLGAEPRGSWSGGYYGQTFTDGHLSDYPQLENGNRRFPAVTVCAERPVFLSQSASEG